MLFFYDGLQNESGIYEIRNRYSNRSYIGQAKNFKSRWKGHRSSFSAKKLVNKFFLNDYFKCKEQVGHDNFLEFHILEVTGECSKKEINLREEYWIKEYEEKNYKLYNFIKNIVIKEKLCYSFNPEITKGKISQSSKKLWVEASDEKKKKMLLNLINTPEQRQATSERIKKVWQDQEKREKIREKINTVISTKEHKKKISDIQKEINSRPGVKEKRIKLAIAASTTPECRKFKSDLAKEKMINDKEYANSVNFNLSLGRKSNIHFWTGFILKSPIGETFSNIINLSEFANKHNLFYKSLWALIKGKLKSHKGWKLI